MRCRGYRCVSFIPALAAALLLIGVLVAPPVRAFDPSHEFEVALGFPDIPMRGAGSAQGMVIWTHPYGGMDQPLPPLILGLAAHGWDVVKLLRNPNREKSWFAVLPHLSDLLVDQAKNAAQLGYKNVILAGQGEGGGLAIEAATKAPVFGVLAVAPDLGQSAYFPAEKSAERVISDLGSLDARRALLVLPAENQALPGIDMSTPARQALTGRHIPYLLVDSQVHGYWGGYSADIVPYAACSVWFFAPPAAVRPGEFHCYHDEVISVMESLNMHPSEAAHIWMGYVDHTGQPVVIVEHHGSAGETVDIGLGNGLKAGTKGQMVQGYPAIWVGNVLEIHPSTTDTVALQPDATPPFWSYRHLQNSSDWTATLNLVLGR